ncbi:MAG: hypothetical protein HKN42_00475 [Granulosicoccus sp.]|nr:hypothetical protein [Granulosicoccus sp.]
MDDLIYSFLLQSGYPRASIIFDTDLLGPVGRVDSGMKAPSFVIVDPVNADLLAVIEVVDAIDGDTLRQVAIETGAYASRLAGKSIQGFVIRVDVRGRTEAEQVQFYRIWPNSTLQQLSSKTFPDLETLRVAKLLSEASIAAAVKSLPDSEQSHKPEDDRAERRPGAGMYFPAFVLLMLVIADSFVTSTGDAPLLSVSQSVLAFGAALLLTLPAAIRFLRR